MGRNDDVIKCSGYRIGPFEVESALLEHPAVVECAITGAPDPIRGQVVKATIVLAKGYEGTPELTKELQNHVKHATAPYKYPRVIEYVDELPKTIGGKIKRAEIRKPTRGAGPVPGLSIRANGSSLPLVLIKRIAHVRAGGWPSEASVKFFAVRPQDVLAFFSKKLRPCPYRRAAQERKLGKQRSAFPGRQRLALSVTAAAVPAPPEGEPSRCATKSLQKAKSCLPLLGGRWSPVGTVQDRPSRQARRSLPLVLIERIAHVRAEGGLPSRTPFKHRKGHPSWFGCPFCLGEKIVPFHFSSGRRCAIVSL